jgi:RimJ/RimL family protein N-acetyltransferase
LQRLRLDDIELVRQMRNREDIREHMLFKNHITPEEQLRWFHSINNIYNNYFLIYADNKKVGLVNGKNADYVNLSSEGGIFIWDPVYRNHLVAPASSLILNDHAFTICRFKKSYIRVLKSNRYALQYNKMMGYQPAHDRPGSDEEDHIWLELTADRYEKYNGRLRHTIGLLTGDMTPLNPNDFSFDDDTDEDLARLISPLPEHIRIQAQITLDKTGRKIPIL